MLGLSTHAYKVNFCKFTNETRLAIEDASAHSGQSYICAINGIAAGGGYELALACDEILLADDGSSAVSLPEVPLLAVLPGTGGLTRLVDKRKVRRDLADVFCTIAEGVRGKRARRMAAGRRARSRRASSTRRGEGAAPRRSPRKSDRPKDAKGIALPPRRAQRSTATRSRYTGMSRSRSTASCRAAHITRQRPRRRAADRRRRDPGARAPPAGRWRLPRELDDAILHLRLNEPEIGTWVLHSQGDAALVAAYDALLAEHADDWLVREIALYWKRTPEARSTSRSRSLFALVEPGSLLRRHACSSSRSPPTAPTCSTASSKAPTCRPRRMRLTGMNFGPLPDGQRPDAASQTRFLADARARRRARGRDRQGARRRGRRRARPRHLHARRHRLGRRGAPRDRGARQLLARRADRHGSQPALRRPRDDGDQDLRPPLGVAELDLPAPQRRRRGGRAQALRHRQASPNSTASAA